MRRGPSQAPQALLQLRMTVQEEQRLLDTVSLRLAEELSLNVDVRRGSPPLGRPDFSRPLVLAASRPQDAALLHLSE